MEMTQLDRDGLAQLRCNLDVLVKAVEVLAAGGFDPVICLGAEGATLTVQKAGLLMLTDARPDAAEPAVGRAVDPPTAPEGMAAVAPAPPRALPPRPAASVPPVVRAPPGQKPKQTRAKRTVVAGVNLWSEDEDARLTGLIVAEVTGGKSWRAAIRASAGHMDRAVPALEFRVYKVLKARILAALLAVPEGSAPVGAAAPVHPNPIRFTPDFAVPNPAAAEIGDATFRPIGIAAAKVAQAVARTMSDLAPASALGTAARAAAAAGVGVPEDLGGLDRRIWRHLEDLGFPPGWDIELDVDMVEAFGRGTKADHLAADLGVDTAAVVSRYKALTAVIRDERGHMTIEGQTRFNAILRRRLIAARQGVAG